MQTITHSALDGKSVRPLNFTNVEDYEDLRRLGLGGFDHIIDAGFGMDSIQGNVTQASIPVQLQFLQQFLPGFVKVMTAAPRSTSSSALTPPAAGRTRKSCRASSKTPAPPCPTAT